jgi:hypothetical protein
MINDYKRLKKILNNDLRCYTVKNGLTMLNGVERSGTVRDYSVTMMDYG